MDDNFITMQTREKILTVINDPSLRFEARNVLNELLTRNPNGPLNLSPDEALYVSICIAEQGARHVANKVAASLNAVAGGLYVG